jgi:hypothetical protein
MADSQSVCLGVEPTLWSFDQILLPSQEFGSRICCTVSVGRPLSREAESDLRKSPANLNNHINKRHLITDFSIVEVLTSIACNVRRWRHLLCWVP